MTSSDWWERIDQEARIGCCFAKEGPNCQGHHPQGTRIVYGYELLAQGVMRAIDQAVTDALKVEREKKI
jgi:hypothetical protein